MHGHLIGCHSAVLPVLGVDGCPGGWVGALLLPRNPVPEVWVAPTISDLYDAARARAEVAVVAIDIPIGLPDVGVRRAEALARQKVKRKASSVFNVLTREAYHAPDRATADVINRSRAGAGVSAQSFSLAKKILEVDAWVRGGPEVEVRECHPEVSFTELAGAPILASKKSPQGHTERRAWLRGAGIDPPTETPQGAGADDVIDACAAAWTAARITTDAATSLPHPPERFSDELPAAMWF